MRFTEKIIDFHALPEWRNNLRDSGRTLVVTHGCFDLLHVGHVTYLERAREEGDALLVGVNGDAAVTTLKGEGRPINNEFDRAALIAALEAVTAACIFPHVKATEFLRCAQPDVWVKGGDYTMETLVPEERETVQKAGGRIVLIPFVAGKSTTKLVEKITRL